MRAKECLSCDRFMPPTVDCSHSGTQRFACGHWAHRASTGFEPALLQKKQSILPLKDEAVLRIRCWRSGSVQAAEVQACALTIVPLHPNMAAGGWWR